MLTAEQTEQLRTAGVARVPAVLPRAEAAAIEDRVWVQLERRGMRRADPSTWPPGFLGQNQGLQQAKVFDAFACPTTNGIVDDLLGVGAWDAPASWGQALISFPERGEWTLTNRMWHFDLPGRGEPDQPAAARLFGFVVDVEPFGGGTLVVEGSHELVRRMVARGQTGSSSQLRRRLAGRHPWFRALLDPDAGAGDRVRQLMVDGDEIDGVRVRVAELSASAGDVVVMMPWTMHATSTHAGERPRIIANHACYRTGSTIFWKSA